MHFIFIRRWEVITTPSIDAKRDKERKTKNEGNTSILCDKILYKTFSRPYVCPIWVLKKIMKRLLLDVSLRLPLFYSQERKKNNNNDKTVHYCVVLCLYTRFILIGTLLSLGFFSSVLCSFLMMKKCLKWKWVYKLNVSNYLNLYFILIIQKFFGFTFVKCLVSFFFFRYVNVDVS